MVKQGDVVLIYRDNRLMTFAKVHEITANEKKDWWNVDFISLSLPLPLTKFTWILRMEQLDGEDFTMGGTPMKITSLEKLLNVQDKKTEVIELPKKKQEVKKMGKVLQLRPKKDEPTDDDEPLIA